MIALSLGGEGEPVPGADLVVNANLFFELVMVRPTFAQRLPLGHVAVSASAAAIGLRDACADVVVAHHFPIQFNRTIDGHGVSDIAGEALRVLKVGGRLDFSCSSCDLDAPGRSLCWGRIRRGAD